jgi:hypothetical protein
MENINMPRSMAATAVAVAACGRGSDIGNCLSGSSVHAVDPDKRQAATDISAE